MDLAVGWHGMANAPFSSVKDKSSRSANVIARLLVEAGDIVIMERRE